MATSFDGIVTKGFRGLTAAQLLESPTSVLLGVSAGDAEKLQQAFGIQSIRQLGSNEFVRRAQSILAATGAPGFDAGPPPEWDTFFQSAPIDHYLQHPARRFRIEFGPVYYRGRLDGSARVIVVGQDPSTNEILGHRVFVGRSGQRVQGLLAKLGLTRSYVMLNTFLFSVYGQFNTELEAISLEAPIREYRNAFLARLAKENPVQAIVAVGRAGHHAARHWSEKGNIPVSEITHPAATEDAVIASWNAELPGLRQKVEPDDDGQADPNPYGAAFTSEDHAPIPRFDLPFGVPEWHGRGGGHSGREQANKIIWTAPRMQ